MSAAKFWRDASERLTYDLANVAAADYPAICQAVVTGFALTPESELVVGLEQMFWDHRRGEQVIGLEWDIWMGFMVVAKTTDAESLVQDVAEWLRTSRWAKD